MSDKMVKSEAIVCLAAEAITPLTPLPSVSAAVNDALAAPILQVPSRRRRKKSMVWDYFTIEPVGDGCTRACCKRCKQTFAYSTGTKLAGTSHLKRHISLGSCPKVRDRNRDTNPLALTSSPTCNGGTQINGLSRKRVRNGHPHTMFDQDRSTQDIVKMIIMHEYPLHMVEHTAFINFIQNLQPKFKMLDFSRLEAECSGIYLREKQSVRHLLCTLPGRICITLDVYASALTVGYICLTGHFIDCEWKLQRRVLNFTMVSFPHMGSAQSTAIGRCLADWDLVDKLFTITLDDSTDDNIKDHLMNENAFGFTTHVIAVQCYIRILSRIAHIGLGAISQILDKIRRSVQYVRSSHENEERFSEIVCQHRITGNKPLCLDVQNQWNTSFFMLLAACDLKQAFFSLEACDSNYKYALCNEEWMRVEIMCKYLKVLYEGTNVFVGGIHPTSNAYFHEAWKIQLELAQGAASKDFFVTSLVKDMHETFSKYWVDCNVVLAMALVMDPRFKMKLVEFNYSKFYGERACMHVKTVDDNIHNLYMEYSRQPLPLSQTCNGQTPIANESKGSTILSSADALLDFDVYISEISTTQQTKSELDQYLEESLVPRIQEFDILNWWKLNKLKYPTLSQMARDILAVPLSTVAPEFIFNTGSLGFDDYRSSLKPETLEAIVCTKDWLHHHQQQEQVVATNSMERVEY